MATTRTVSPYWAVGCIVAFLHLTLFVRDTQVIDGFFRADRASQRFHALQRVIEGGHENYAAFIAALVRNGIIGDYGLHAVFYSLGGPLAVIAFQVLLGIGAALCVVYIGSRAFSSKNMALAAGLLYGVLPQSLAFPHQLLTESIANPFLIFGTAGLLHALENPRARNWFLAGLAMGIAALIRPALMLLPLIAAALLIGLRGGRAYSGKAAIVAVSGLAPFVLWCMFMLVQVGKFGPGESTQDLGLNFSQSTAKVLLSEGLAPADGKAPDWLPQRLTLGQYLGYVINHPKGFANLYFKNIFVMLSDSGIGRLYVDLLGNGAQERLALQDPSVGWRAELTNHGPLAMLRAGWRLAPGTILAGVLGALGFAMVNLGALIAYVVLLRGNSLLRNTLGPLQQRWCLAFLLATPIYVLATSEVVAYAPSRLRSQGEFAWAILACFGWAIVRQWRRRVIDFKAAADAA